MLDFPTALTFQLLGEDTKNGQLIETSSISPMETVPIILISISVPGRTLARRRKPERESPPAAGR